MKHFLAVVLSACLVLGMAVSSFAVDFGVSSLTGFSKIYETGYLGVIPVSSSPEHVDAWSRIINEFVSRPDDRVLFLIAEERPFSTWSSSGSYSFTVVSHDKATFEYVGGVLHPEPDRLYTYVAEI